jgi:DNA-binding LytR/AlgR family response regulator
MIDCFIIDDEFSAIHILSEYISITPGLQLIGTFESPLIALEKIREGIIPDVVFLDINMPKLSGLQVAQQIPKSSQIIFTTAYSKFAVKAFEYNAFDYLLKPISHERFIICIEKLWQYRSEKSSSEKDDHFFIQSELKGKLIRININELIFAESLQNYLQLYLVSGKYKTYLSMSDIQAYLPSNQFTRVHKSFIINNNKVLSVEKNLINLENNYTVNIGESFREAFLNKLKGKVLKTTRN